MEEIKDNIEQVLADLNLKTSTFDQIKTHLEFLKKNKSTQNGYSTDKINNIIYEVEKVLIYRARREILKQKVDLGRADFIMKALEENDLVCDKNRELVFPLVQKICELKNN